MKLLKQLVNFVGIGGLLAVGSIIIYYITLTLLGWSVYPVYITVYCVAVWISYKLNARYTFNQESSKSGLLKYYAIYGIGLCIGLGLIYMGKHFTGFTDFWVTIGSLVPRTIIVFLLSKLFIFRSSSVVAQIA